MNHSKYLRKISFLTLVLAAISLLFLEGCNRCEVFQSIDVSSGISFVIKDKNRFIFDVYPIDSFLVYFNNQKFEAFSTSKSYGSVGLGNIYNEDTDQAAFSSQVCKDYIFRYTYQEIDTIRVCFAAIKDGNCGYQFKVLEVFYDGKKLEQDVRYNINR